MKKLFEGKTFKVVILVLGIIIFAMALAFALVKFNVFQKKPVAYSMIYLQTGDIYFGELSQFPYPVLKNGYILQRGQDGGASLLPISSTIWEPSGYVRLNRDAIVFTAPLAKTSAIYRMIIAQQQGGAAQGSPVPLTPNSSLLQPESSIEPSPVLSPLE